MAKRVSLRDWFVSALSRLPFAPSIAAMFAVAAATLVGATPYWLFVKLIVASGLPDVVAAATPPLGDKARIVAMIAAALITGLLVWAGLAIGGRLLRPSKSSAKRGRGSTIHPGGVSKAVAGRRAPIFADSELGAPLMSDEAMEQAREELILETPMVVAEAPSEPVAHASDELPIVPELPADLTPPAAAPTPEIVPSRPLEQLPIGALLARLEAALERREGAVSPIGDIATLRAVARQV